MDSPSGDAARPLTARWTDLGLKHTALIVTAVSSDGIILRVDDRNIEAMNARQLQQLASDVIEDLVAERITPAQANKTTRAIGKRLDVVQKALNGEVGLVELATFFAVDSA